MAYVFEVRHKHVANDLNILNMASICGGRFKYLRNPFTILEMTLEFVEQLIYVGNDVHMWKMT